MSKLSNYKNVAVIEIGGGKYHYALYDENIKAGDTVLVTGNMSRTPLTVENVISVEEARIMFTKDITAEVMCKVDLSDYNKRVESRKEVEKLKKEMDKEIKKMDETRKYEMYADMNPVLADMLDRLKEINIY